MDVREGGKFSLYGGTVEGEYVLLKPFEKIKQKWRFSSWEDGIYSEVTLKFVEEPKGTTNVSLE